MKFTFIKHRRLIASASGLAAIQAEAAQGVARGASNQDAGGRALAVAVHAADSNTVS